MLPVFVIKILNCKFVICDVIQETLSGQGIPNSSRAFLLGCLLFRYALFRSCWLHSDTVGLNGQTTGTENCLQKSPENSKNSNINTLKATRKENRQPQWQMSTKVCHWKWLTKLLELPTLAFCPFVMNRSFLTSRKVNVYSKHMEISVNLLANQTYYSIFSDIKYGRRFKLVSCRAGWKRGAYTQ